MFEYSTDHSNNCSASASQNQTACIDAAIPSMQRKDQNSDFRAHLIRQLSIIDTYMVELSTILLALSQQLHHDQLMTMAKRKCQKPDYSNNIDF